MPKLFKALSRPLVYFVSAIFLIRLFINRQVIKMQQTITAQLLIARVFSEGFARSGQKLLL